MIVPEKIHVGALEEGEEKKKRSPKTPWEKKNPEGELMLHERQKGSHSVTSEEKKKVNERDRRKTSRKEGHSSSELSLTSLESAGPGGVKKVRKSWT